MSTPQAKRPRAPNATRRRPRRARGDARVAIDLLGRWGWWDCLRSCDAVVVTVPATRLTVLGHLGVEGDGVAGGSGLPGRRAELVFAYLAVEHDRMVSRDELADALWPDLLPD